MPSGTLSAVTSDDNDSTYALWGGQALPLVLQTPIDAPPAGERRHQVRVRIRGEDGAAWWAVRLQNGALTGGASATFPASPGNVNGSWGFGVPPDGNTILAAHILGQTSGVKITEVYIDMDSREAPDFTLQVIDGSGTSVTLVTDTSTPALHAESIDTDDLALRQYRYWITQGSTIVWDTGVLPGSPSDERPPPLANGSYVAHGQVWTTLGRNTAYASAEETLAFTVNATGVPMPVEPVVTPVEGSPFYQVQVCSPMFGAYVQLQRIDCAASDDPTVTDLTLIGPLGVDECATYVDYSIPRVGLGAACEEPPEQCCSYYRVRTVWPSYVDTIEISAWSDARGSGVPYGLIFLWPDTEASIPAGFSRKAALDGIYARGLTPGSQPRDFSGGANSHNHFGSAGNHQHDISHLHTVSGNTSTAVGTFASTPNNAGTQGVPATHTHTRSSVNTTTLNSGQNGATVSSSPNHPALVNLIHIESQGTAAGIPNSTVAVTADTTITGWTDYANATGRFLRGASTGASGGDTAASQIANHTHALGAHTHSGPSHTHTSPDVGAVAGSLSLTGGAGASVTYAVSHSHAVTVASANASPLDSGGAGDSGATSPDDPPWVNVRVRQNTSGAASIPVGVVGIWRGSLGSIPEQWELCDGTGGKPDLNNSRFPRGATASIGATGGSETPHSHTVPSHTHTTTQHAHSMTIGASNGAVANAIAGAAITVATGTHTHTGSNTNNTIPTVGAAGSGVLSTQDTVPPFEEVAFVQLMEPFTPHPGPEQVCFSWPENEHLLRTEGPDGPIWAPVRGLFAWDVSRPLTATTGVNGGRFLTGAEPGARNHTMTAGVESEEELNALLAVLKRPLVLISPSDSAEVWGAPIAASVSVVKVGRIRQVTADFIGTGPQPGPQVADIEF